jgi:tRNA (Thr-GGU) A37 N-methylase
MSYEKKNNIYECSCCGKEKDARSISIVDDKIICVQCLYENNQPFQIYPIGFVRNSLRRAETGFGTAGVKGVSRIELFESQKPFLYKLEDEPGLTVIYYLHQANKVESVFNRGLDGKKVGVFASRTPYRLSRLAIQDVSLIKIEGTTLFVEGLDAVDGSPVLDIKMKW